MANFSVSDFQNFSADPLSQLAELNTVNYQTIVSLLSSNTDPFYVHHQSPDFPGKSAETFPEIFLPSNQNPFPVSVPCARSKVEEFLNNETKKRKAIPVAVASENSCSGISSISGQVSQNENFSTAKRSRKGKRSKNNDEQEEKLREVVHVRARRGQATDSHSLAERVRRGKINERLRCLQDIVPGCYKTMGMATMLDEIINYVQSLQNQVEFLSMKLATASTFYDFNSETDAIDSVQRAKARETMEMGRQVKDGNAVFNSSWAL